MGIKSKSFLGRCSDYQKKYIKAIKHYQDAIETVKLDPEYIDGFPRQLEYQAFLCYSVMMSGNVKKGLKLSQIAYRDFDNTKDGKRLKSKDYTTWAIWKTGIAIRAVNTLVDVNSKLLTKDEMIEWIDEAKELLTPPKGVKVWVDFGFRKTEVENIYKKL
ncbi:hypothetical protein ACFL0F_01850 [Patescibacteria group bacterium]